MFDITHNTGGALFFAFPFLWDLSGLSKPKSHFKPYAN
jgi:hypothetical protein